MSQPRERKTFDSSIVRHKPGSAEVLHRTEAGRNGRYSNARKGTRPQEELQGQEHESAAAKLKRKALEKTPQKFKNPSNLQVRIRTGAVYISLTVLCVLFSNASAAIYLSVLSAICAGEFYFMLRSDAKLPNEFLGIGAAALFPLAMWLFGGVGVGLLFVAFTIVLLLWYITYLRARVSDVAISLFGAVYTGLLMSFAMAIRMALPSFWGGVLVVGIFCTIWGNDAFAYLAGSRFGKHKMAPAISPKKSWEGFVAGIAFSMAFWCLLTLIPGVSMSIAQALVFGAICGGAGVVGDLVESRIKRNSGFKDSGTIMPGHGGLLDRCDSQFLVIVCAALLLIAGGCIPNVLF